MIDWRQYWDEYPKRFGDDEFCKHVARTVNGGVPIAESELRLIVELVRSTLKLQPTDRLLDLCCGNGLLTHRMAAGVATLVGVDFAKTMLDIARTFHAAPNLSYIEHSVLDLSLEVLQTDQPFTQVSLIESLHYLNPADLEPLMKGLHAVTSSDARVLFVGVTDADRIWNFFNTPERKRSYEEQKKSGREIMGHWWRRDEITTVASKCGFHVSFLPQNEHLNTAHYRLDVLLERRERSE